MREAGITLIRDTIESFELSTTGSRRSTAYESATGFGCDVLICDDPHATAVSDSEREKDLDLWDRGLSNRAGAAGSYIVLMQRVGPRDLIGHLLSQDSGYDYLTMPCEYDPTIVSHTKLNYVDPRTVPGQPLWPSLFNEERIKQEKRRIGTFNFSTQFQQSPIDRDAGLVKLSWFNYWTEETLPKFHETLISLDTSFKGGITNDYNVMQLWGRHNMDFYLLDQVRIKATFTELLATFTAFCEKYSFVPIKIVESSANGSAICDSLRTRITGIVPVVVRDSKVARLQAVAPLIESKHVWIPKSGASWIEEFLSEIVRFPLSANDDQTDALTLALIRLRVTSLRNHTTQTGIALWA